MRHRPGLVHRQLIDHQNHRFNAPRYQPFERKNELCSREPAAADVIPKRSLRIDHPNDASPLARSKSLNYRCPPFRTIASPKGAATMNFNFIQEIDLRTPLFSALFQLRISSHFPLPNCSPTPFRCPPRRLPWLDP